MSELSPVATVADRVSFLVDGFNLYHSLKAAAKVTESGPYKWLDLAGFCRSYLPLLGTRTTLERIYYFSAFAHHSILDNPDVVRRHQVYLRALKAHDVRIELGQFKQKTGQCASCHSRIKFYEEKETDVAIAVRCLELAMTHACETIVLVSGDTDLAPALRAAKRLAPTIRLCTVFPFGRHNAQLQQLADQSFTVGQTRYAQHQFPDTLQLSAGKTIHKPVTW